MHNTYINSTISTISFRSKGSLSFSLNDYSYYLNERYEKTPSSLSPSCCACCALCIHRVPINPSLLYGLRQSTLIQWSASRRLILGNGDRYYYRIPVYGSDRGCYGVTCCVKERSVGGRRERRGKGRFGCMVMEGKSEWRHSGGVDDAEVMLSLLTEEVGEECFGVRERSGGSSKRVRVEKRGNVDERFGGKKENVGSGSLGSNSKSVTMKMREEGCKQSEEREALPKGEDRRARRGDSGCSSYYSFSSSGGFESDREVQAKHGWVVGESSSGYDKDSRTNGEGRFVTEVVEELEKHRDDTVGHGEALKQGNTAVGSDLEWDCRKKSEKKLAKVSLEQTKSTKESSQMHSGVSGVHESGFRKASSSHKQFDAVEDRLTLAGNLGEETRKQNRQTGSQVIGQSKSRMKYQQQTEVLDIDGSDVATISRSQNRFYGGEENLSAAVNVTQKTKEDCGKGSRITKQDELGRNSQQPAETLKIQDNYIERPSNLQRQSETRMKNLEERSILVLNSVQEAKEQHHRTGEWIIGQIDSRKSSQQSSDISEIDGSDVEKTSTSQCKSESTMKNEGSLNLVFSSHPGAKQQRFQTDRKDIRRTESRKRSQDVTSISLVHAGDTETVTNSQGAFEERMSSQERYLTSAMKSVEETRYRQNQTDERLLEIESRKEAQRFTKLSSFHGSTSEEASSTQASLDSVAQSRVQKFCADEGDKRSPQAIVTPPESQLVARGSLHVEGTSGSATQGISKETSESGSSSALHHELYGEGRRGETYVEPSSIISHEDAMGSADRLEKSSMQFVGEFVEKARQEVSTSKIWEEEKLSKTKLVYEGEKQMQKGFRYGSEDSQSKEHNLRRSSGGLEAKGPSDEMWDVTNSSVREPPKTEAPEGTTTSGNAIVRRTGRSLWSIMTDIVRMRWVSHATVKSGGKSSSNESVSSEAWFSGHEPDENYNENEKREKRSTVQESTSADPLQLGKSSPKSQREGSDSMSSKDKIRHVEADTSSSSTILESGPAFPVISSASVDENLVSNESGKNFQVPPLSTVIVESSLPLPTGQIRRSPTVVEITDSGKDDVSVSGSMERIEQPLSGRLTAVSGSEGKDGELKRRKLQRNKQVLKDRFEEWEEAYKLESEQRKIDEIFMREALLEAKKAADNWEVPVGAVLVQHGKVIARGYNLVEELRDSTAHAEMICIREASNLLQTWRLAEATLYVTLEPCPMCAGAILQARINTLVWGAPNKLLGADGSWIRLFPNGGEGGNGSEFTDKPPAPVHPFHPKMTIRRGVLESECADVMQQFFQLRRRKKEKKPDPPTPPSCLPVAHHPSKLLTKMHEIFNAMFCL